MCHTSFVSFFFVKETNQHQKEQKEKQKIQTEVHIFCKLIITFWLWCLVTGDTNTLLHHYHTAQP